MKRDTNALYGLERNRLSRVRSDDGGDNWWTVTELEYAEAEADTGNVCNLLIVDCIMIYNLIGRLTYHIQSDNCQIERERNLICNLTTFNT